MGEATARIGILVGLFAVMSACSGLNRSGQGAAGNDRGAGASESQGERSANTAPDFTLRDLSGRLVRLSDHTGKVVLLNFWATWCVPCAAELPHLEAFYKEYGPDHFIVLGIAMDGPETAADVAPRARRYGLTFPVLVDEETRVVSLYNPKRNAPFSVFIDRDGEIAKVREGYHAGDELEIEADIRELLGAGAPTR